MPISSVIQQRRKLLGLTQEQIAETLGVSAPAVNKWEKGVTCPDISLLSPLARLLEIDLNTLLGFYSDITREELRSFSHDMAQSISSEGISAAFLIAQQKLKEYPTSDQLLLQVALQLQNALTFASPLQNAENYQKIIDSWYDRLSHSHEALIRNNACFMLASRSIASEDLKSAQNYLDQIPDRNSTPDKRMLQSTIYKMEKRPENAVSLLETALLTTVGELQMFLGLLVDANIAAGFPEIASYVSERAAAFSALFDLSPYHAAIAEFQLASGIKDPEKTVEALKKMLHPDALRWNLHCSPLYSRIQSVENNSSLETIVHTLIKQLRDSPEFDYLHTSDIFQNFLEKFDLTR